MRFGRPRLTSSELFCYAAGICAVRIRSANCALQTGRAPGVAGIRPPGRIGLIHTDLIWKNYFFHDQEVGAVDFEGCAWGYYLYDLAPTLLGYRDESAYPALRDALIAGYRTIRPFPTSHERHLNTLIAARHVVSCCWLANHLDHPDLRKRADEIVLHRTTAIRSLLQDTG
jgi:Ser/Thr protein kinase RdoA (MazF antagonist)